MSLEQRKLGAFLHWDAQDAGGEMTAHDLISRLLWAVPESRENGVWAYGLVVEVWGEREGRGAKCTYRNSHPPQAEWGGPAAYFKNVGIPLSVGAQVLAKGQVEAKGVVPPAIAFPTQPFFDQLAQRGIQAEEEIEEREPWVANGVTALRREQCDES